MASNGSELRDAVLNALKGIQNSRTGANVVEGEQIEELRIDDEGGVHFRFVLQQEDPGALVREARTAVNDVDGVGKVRIEVKLPETMQASRQKPKHGTRQGGSGGGLKPGSVPAPTPDDNRRTGIQRVVAVSSGKGGVGKSTIAANLAAALAAAGHRVGLMDADVYGPDIPLLFGTQEKPKVTGEKGEEKIVPLEAHGVRLISLGFLMDDEQPAIMRGPLVSGILRQFLDQVEWGELDYLIVDLPPGTGDAQLSLVQTIDLDGAVMVTTPQQMSTGDVRRAIRMFERVNTPVLGVVENMSGFVCPHCDETVDVFGRGGGREMAEAMHVDFLGDVPLDPRVRESGDEGRISALAAAESPAGRALRGIAERVEEATMAAVGAGA